MNSLTTKITKLFIQYFQERISPTFVNPTQIPSIFNVVQACYQILKEEELVTCLKDHRNRLVEILLSLMPFPHVHYHFGLVSFIHDYFFFTIDC